MLNDRYVSLLCEDGRLTFHPRFCFDDPPEKLVFDGSDGLTYRISYSAELFTARACVEIWLVSEWIPPVSRLLCKALVVGVEGCWYPVMCDAGRMDTFGFARQGLFRLLVNSPSFRDNAELALLMLYSGVDLVR